MIHSLRFTRVLLTAGLLAGASLSAQESAPEKPDPFSLEADFINYLLNQGMFTYANKAIQEAQTAFPGDKDRLEVLEVGVLLRQGKTDEVEKILSKKNLARDPKAQAMLLQQAMTLDAMNQNDIAVKKYQQFLKLNEGKEITDPDVIRYFASAGLRLSTILKEAGNYEGASKVLDQVVKTTDGDVLKRKFQLLSAQNRLEQALTQSGKKQQATLVKMDKTVDEILFGANDQYLQMAVGLKAWGDHLRGKTSDAKDMLGTVKDRSVAMEKSLAEAGIPKSEFPRPLLRYVEGTIQWDEAKKLYKSGNEVEAKKSAIKAAGNFYNTFLKYDGNEFGDRSALAFEDLKVWVEESFGSPLKGGDNPRMRGLIFKRQLDLAKKLLLDGDPAVAEERLLEALGQYPETQFTPLALDTLSRIWIEQDREWELLALAEHVAETYPDTDEGAQLLLRIGRGVAESEDLEKLEVVLGSFGRNYPSHPRAPAMLFRVAEAAAERGDAGTALEFYDDILEFYPQSNFAVRVLQLRGEEAIKSENTEEAIKAFSKVRDQSRQPMQVAFARMRIADAKLSSGDPELEVAAIQDLIDLREDLEDPSGVYAQKENRKQTEEFIQNIRYRTGRKLLMQAGVEKTEEARQLAAKELNSFLQEYPKASQAPDVMFNLGRLYLQQGKFEDATRTFEELSRKYPKSDAGKDALYSLVRAALEEEQVEVARQAVEKMVANPDSYEIEKIYRVAQLMLEFEQWEEAQMAFELVMQSPKIAESESLKQRTLAGLGDAAVGAGDLEEAVSTLQTLIEEYPKSTMVLKGGVSLAEAYLAMDPPQPAKAKQALAAVGRVLRSRPDKAAKARLDIMLGRVAMAEEDPGAALASWYGVGLGEANTPELAMSVREAIELSLEEAQRQIDDGNLKRWNLVIELTDQYLRNFPMDTAADDMRALNVRAIGLAPKE